MSSPDDPLAPARDADGLLADDEERADAADVADDDDEIVLAWWQHPVNVITVVVATALIAGMIGWLIGDSNAGPDPNEVDVGFLQDMRDHHEQAVFISNIYLALQDTDPGLRTVARSISFGQAVDIGRMIQLLRDFNEPEVNEGETAMAWMGMPVPIAEMPGMATQEQLDELGSLRGAEADAMFAELMIAHHEGGIHMAEYAAQNGNVAEVRNMATSMADSQRHEIAEIEGLLT